jgi:hypothetical protein
MTLIGCASDELPWRLVAFGEVDFQYASMPALAD